MPQYVNNVCKNSFTDGGFNILGHCKKWQADEAFMFISGVLWLLSALLVSALLLLGLSPLLTALGHVLRPQTHAQHQKGGH